MEYKMKEIKVLGPGCPKCEQLMQQTEAAAKELGLECVVEKVTDIMKITDYGVMMTPALIVDGQIKVTGKVPSLEEIKKMLV
jgi:small redox-active disulfide protein 2